MLIHINVSSLWGVLVMKLQDYIKGERFQFKLKCVGFHARSGHFFTKLEKLSSYNSV